MMASWACSAAPFAAVGTDPACSEYRGGAPFVPRKIQRARRIVRRRQARSWRRCGRRRTGERPAVGKSSPRLRAYRKAPANMSPAPLLSTAYPVRQDFDQCLAVVGQGTLGAAGDDEGPGGAFPAIYGRFQIVSFAQPSASASLQKNQVRSRRRRCWPCPRGSTPPCRGRKNSGTFSLRPDGRSPLLRRRQTGERGDQVALHVGTARRRWRPGRAAAGDRVSLIPRKVFMLRSASAVISTRHLPVVPAAFAVEAVIHPAASRSAR